MGTATVTKIIWVNACIITGATAGTSIKTTECDGAKLTTNTFTDRVCSTGSASDASLTTTVGTTCTGSGSTYVKWTITKAPTATVAVAGAQALAISAAAGAAL